MFKKTDIREAFRSLLAARQRSILALIGIVIGIASVIGMVSIGAIVRQEALRQYLEMGVDIIKVEREYSVTGKEIHFSLPDILEIKKSVPSIIEVAPFLISNVSFFYRGQGMYVETIGVTGAFFDMNKLSLEEGRFLTDLDEGRYFCVLGNETAGFIREAGTTNLIGQKLLFGERIYTVIGVLKKKAEGGGIRAGNVNMSMITHISTGSRSFDRGEINAFLARTAGGSDTNALKSEISEYFRKKSGMEVRVLTAEEMIEQMQKDMRLFTLLLGAIGSISLIVGGIGVMNVMLISIAERRKEIGIRRALGAQREDIQRQFIAESVFLCLAGGAIGIVLGVGISYIFAYFSGWAFIVSVPAIVFGVGVATATGVFFGYYPARSASRLDPIAALRS